MSRSALLASAIPALSGLGGVLLLDHVRQWRRRRRRTGRAPDMRRVVALAGASVVASPFVPSPAVTVPVSTLVSPALALAVLSRIMEVRRRQSRADDGSLPAVLCDSDSETLAALVRSARAVPPDGVPAELDFRELPPEVCKLLDSVEKMVAPESHGPATEWRVLVRLLGEPVVENEFGERAVFGKKRALELLAWMVLNKDRSTRSAARTALWDGTVHDATFSTVLSDLRRALSRIAPLNSHESWSPVTYSESLPVAPGIVTDIDLVVAATRSGNREDLISALALVRDLPFAGTTWIWPDLDGSTTRAVIAVIRAVNVLLEVCDDCGDSSGREIAIQAGLRVQPGDEELLALQRQLLPSRGSALSKGPVRVRSLS